MDWHEIERRLVERAEEVCRHLLPNGRRVAQEWCVGSLAGEAGDSLKVNLAGKVGVWADFAADKRGKTLMSLWCSVRGEAFRVCIQEAKGWLGVPEDYYERRIRPAGNSRETPNREAGNENEWTVEQQWGRCEGLTEDGPVWRYLVEERRIEEGVLEVFGVRELALAGNRWAMVFPYYAPHEREEESQVEAAIRAQAQERPKGETAKDLTGGNEGNEGGKGGKEKERIPSWLKFEALERVDGKKKEWTTRGPEKCLWGMQVCESAMFRKADHLLICEGEKDALSWASYGCGNWRVAGSGGVLPVSVPFGAKWRSSLKGGHPRGQEFQERPSPNREWLDRCWEWMQGFETIFVGMDMDEAGRKGAADIITEIGPRRCRLVELPMRGEFLTANQR